MPIGELARRAGVPTSTVRYYERRGLILPDARVSGQRRYAEPALRKLVFVGMLQDAGLALDDIEAVLGAPDNDAWKAVARERLATLEAHIATLQHASALLQGALLCRYDHPLDECAVMGTEIDRRLTEFVPDS